MTKDLAGLPGARRNRRGVVAAWQAPGGRDFFCHLVPFGCSTPSSPCFTEIAKCMPVSPLHDDTLDGAGRGAKKVVRGLEPRSTGADTIVYSLRNGRDDQNR